MECCIMPGAFCDIKLVGGESQDYEFHMYDAVTKLPFDLTGATCNFAVMNYTSRTSTPTISKAMTLDYGEDPTVLNVAKAHLDPEDTLELKGKFIYQVTIEDAGGAIEIPGQGWMYIADNINKGFIDDD